MNLVLNQIFKCRCEFVEDDDDDNNSSEEVADCKWYRRWI